MNGHLLKFSIYATHCIQQRGEASFENPLIVACIMHHPRNRSLGCWLSTHTDRDSSEYDWSTRTSFTIHNWQIDRRRIKKWIQRMKEVALHSLITTMPLFWLTHQVDREDQVLMDHTQTLKQSTIEVMWDQLCAVTRADMRWHEFGWSTECNEMEELTRPGCPGNCA